MRTIHDLFNDNRLNNICPYCGDYGDTRDHVPSKALLDRPFPNDLPVVPACKAAMKVSQQMKSMLLVSWIAL